MFVLQQNLTFLHKNGIIITVISKEELIMKKIIKYFIVTVLLTMMVFVFAGCSEKKVENNKSTNEEKLVAIKTIQSDIVGEYESRFEFVFENEKLIKVTNISELKTENEAEVFMAAVNASKNETIKGIEYEQDGNKVIMKMDADTYASMSNTKTLTKDAIKKDMEKRGYTVK